MRAQDYRDHDHDPSLDSLDSDSNSNSEDAVAVTRGSSGRRIAIAYLRNDLRIHDNASLYYAHHNENNPTHVLPLYIYDERQVECSGLPGYNRKGPEARTRLCRFWRSGVFKTRFLTEAVYDVQHRLRDRGSGMLVRFGLPEDIIVNLVRALQARGDEVVAFEMQKEMCAEEIAVENKIKRRLKDLGIHNYRSHHTKEMIHQDDLPFPISNVPDVFTPFRKRVEALGDKMVRKMLEMPERFLPFPDEEGKDPIRDDDNYGYQIENWTFEKTLECLFQPLKGIYEMKYASPGSIRHKSSAFPWMGGETSALDRLDYYFLAGRPPPVSRYKETRNMLLGHEYSTKMSPFLAIGCISPRQIIAAIDAHEENYGSSQNTYWVRFELLWRDYFLYVAQKFGNHLFKLEGYEGITDPKMANKKLNEWNDWNSDDHLLKAWLRGRTGVPFIDANIVELRETGFMSNRGRQNVASFLTKDLYYDWRIGAEFFESHLVDYEPTANWGNWQYVAGVGNDPRASRQFNPIKQARDYDPHGDYVRTWIVQLSDIPDAKVHTPWLLNDTDWHRYLGKHNTHTPQSRDNSNSSSSMTFNTRPSVVKGTSRQALSTEAVGRLELSDGQRLKGANQDHRNNTRAAQSGSDGDGPSSSYLRTTGSSGRRSVSISESGNGSASGTNSDRYGTGRRGCYASESTGASSYTSSEVGGVPDIADRKSQTKIGAGAPSSSYANATVRPPSNRSRSSGTSVSENETGSTSSSVAAPTDASKQSNESKNIHPSASCLSKDLNEKDDYFSDTPYPRTPLFEQESWKPHYNRKDHGRKRNGPGGGNSRRLIRGPSNK